jgi:putative nucleotidyltransferase with HDIG domain
METIKQLIESVEILPPAPNLLSKLLVAINDIDANFDEIVNFIELDPSLTAKLLQICNSAFFGTEDPLVDVRDAVSRIGYQAIYLLVSMIKGSESFRLPPNHKKDAAALWKHAVVTAYASQFVAMAAGANASLAFTGGLLHDIGKVVFFKSGGDYYKLLMKKASDARTSSYEFEISAYGFSHADVGQSLLRQWVLPETLIESVKFHHTPDQAGAHESAAACLYVGNVLAHGFDYPKSHELPLFIHCQTVLNLTEHDIEHCNEQLKANWARVEQMCYLA